MAQVFISYSQRDRKATGDTGSSVIVGNPVDKITRALAAAGISYWIDEEGLALGTDYADSVALYLSPIQYVDWADGEEKAIAQIIARIQEKPGVARLLEALPGSCVSSGC